MNLFKKSILARFGWMLGGVLPIVLALYTPLSRAQEKTEPIQLELQVIVSPNANPDDKMRPQPVEIRVYELKENQAFNGFDYFSLYNKDKDVLGGDFIKKDSFLMRPGESQKISRKSDTQTRFIGVLAGYLNLGKTVWRTSYKLPEPNPANWTSFFTLTKKAKLQIHIEEAGLRITEAE